MNQNQKNIMRAYFTHPRATDRKIADVAGVSQPTVTRCRHRFVDEELLSFVAVPGLDKLGYEIVAMNTLVIRSDKDRTALKGDKNVVFAIEIGYKTALVVSVHKNYDSYDRFIDKYQECDVEPYKATILFLASNKPIKPFSFKDIP